MECTQFKSEYSVSILRVRFWVILDLLYMVHDKGTPPNLTVACTILNLRSTKLLSSVKIMILNARIYLNIILKDLKCTIANLHGICDRSNFSVSFDTRRQSLVN